MAQVHHYKRENGLYTHSTPAKRSPLEKDIVYIVPANATLLEPLTVPSTHVNVFSNGAWTAVEDKRGQVVFNKDTLEKVIWNELSEIPEIYTELEPKEYEFWNGTAWETDDDKLAAIRDRNVDMLLSAAFETQKKQGMDQNFFSLMSAIALGNSTDPKFVAVKTWLDTDLWAVYYARKNDILTDITKLDPNLDFSSVPYCPHDFLEIRTEAGV